MYDMTATADLYDQYGEALACCSTQLLRYGGRARFHGEVVTLKGHEDNALLKVIVSEPGHGKIIVIDGGGSLHSAMLGDKNARQAASNGWEGFVVHGAVRDVAQLASIDIGILALGTSPRKSNKDGKCDVNVPVAFGGVIFAPGAHLVADEDGLVLLPVIDTHVASSSL
jgi:regulator of ribonuclease activity A